MLQVKNLRRNTNYDTNSSVNDDITVFLYTDYLERKVFFSTTDFRDLRDFSLALVIYILIIPDICGYIFHSSLFTYFWSASPSLLIRFSSHSRTIGSWEVNGSYYGLTWELLRTCNGGRREVSLWLTLSFDIVLHAHHLAIEDGVGELPYPVAENHESA